MMARNDIFHVYAHDAALSSYCHSKNQTNMKEKLIDILIGAAIGAVIVFCLMFRGCIHGPSQYALVKTDTLIHFIHQTDTAWHTVQIPVGIPYEVRGKDTVYIKHVEQVLNHDTVYNLLYTFSTDTAVYADSIRQANEFKAILTDTLFDNRIIGRQIRWANLSPIEVKTIDNTVVKKQSLVKLYLGVDAYGGKASGKVNVDIAPAASLVFADKYMLDLGYYILNQQVTAGVKVKLSFIKP
jgi:hypothetical protein